MVRGRESPSAFTLPEQLQAELATARAHILQLQSELDLRNSALDAARGSHFVIADVRLPNIPLVYVNAAAANDCGYAPEEMVGMPALSFFPAALNQTTLDQMKNALSTATPFRAEMLARRKDGSTFWLGLSMTFLRNAQDQVTHLVGIATDITARLEQQLEQRRLQDQLYSEMRERERMAIELRLAQKLESVGRLAAGIAHEINTPIQYVGDSLHFLQTASAELQRLVAEYEGALAQCTDGSPPAEARERLEGLREVIDLPFLAAEIPKAFARTLSGVERVTGIVRALKEFAHPDASEHAIADINHALETTLVVARNEYKYSAEIETRLAPLPEVTCNIGELNQVFLNLIVNAAQAIRQSGQDATTGRITITSEVNDAAVVVSIADNGCGITPENLERIFDPFFTTKPVGQGTGQGLAIARSIVVEKHGGAIDVESTPGKGARFIVRLPVAGFPQTSNIA